MPNKNINQKSEKTFSFKEFISNHLVIMILLIILIAFCVAIYNYCKMFGTEFSDTHARWGEFGDFFGGFLGGISIIAVVYTLIIQQKQLKLQQTELKEQRNQQKLDSYERMVFWLIDSNQKILDEIYSSKYQYEKENGFSGNTGETQYIVREKPLLDGIYDLLINNKLFSMYSETYYSLSIQREFLKDHRFNLINTYCRNLFNALKTIEKRFPMEMLSELSDSQKINEIKKYTSLLRSFIPEKMVYTIAVNITNPDPIYNAYRILVKKYSMLEHMSFDFLYSKANDEKLLGIIKNQSTYPTEIRELEEEITKLKSEVDIGYPNNSPFMSKHIQMIREYETEKNICENEFLNQINYFEIYQTHDFVKNQLLPYFERQYSFSDKFKNKYNQIWNEHFNWIEAQGKIHSNIKDIKRKVEQIKNFEETIIKLKKEVKNCISHQLIIELGEEYFNSNQIYKDIKDKFNAVGFEFPIYSNKEEINTADSNTIQNKEQQP